MFVPILISHILILQNLQKIPLSFDAKRLTPTKLRVTSASESQMAAVLNDDKAGQPSGRYLQKSPNLQEPSPRQTTMSPLEIQTVDSTNGQRTQERLSRADAMSKESSSALDEVDLESLLAVSLELVSSSLSDRDDRTYDDHAELTQFPAVPVGSSSDQPSKALAFEFVNKVVENEKLCSLFLPSYAAAATKEVGASTDAVTIHQRKSQDPLRSNYSGPDKNMLMGKDGDCTGDLNIITATDHDGNKQTVHSDGSSDMQLIDAGATYGTQNLSVSVEDTEADLHISVEECNVASSPSPRYDWDNILRRSQTSVTMATDGTDKQTAVISTDYADSEKNQKSFSDEHGRVMSHRHNPASYDKNDLVSLFLPDFITDTQVVFAAAGEALEDVSMDGKDVKACDMFLPAWMK